MGEGIQLIDIIFFAMIAAFLVLRLRSVLGRRDGHEGGHHDPFSSANVDKQKKDNVVQLPEHGVVANEDGDDDALKLKADEEPDQLAAGFTKIRQADSIFDAKEFISGACIAFEMVIKAYADGDADALKPLLSVEVFSNFAKSITERKQAKEVLEETLVSIKKAEIVEAYMEGSVANVTIKFVSEQISVTFDADGEVIDGNPDYVAEITDFWTFIRDTKARDPNWVLAATRSLD